MTSPIPTEGGHTPGPWSVEQYGDGDSLVIHAGGEWRICFMATPGDSPGAMRRIEANARLIAAAPALLEALQAQEDQQRRGILNMTDAEVERVTTLRRAALAQATGGEDVRR